MPGGHSTQLATFPAPHLSVVKTELSFSFEMDEACQPIITLLCTIVPGVRGGIGFFLKKKNLAFISQDNFLRGDSSRRVQHQQPRKPRKKTKPPALTKKHKKKRRRGPRRPQKPIPPAVPQGNLSMPTSVSLPVEASQIRSVGAVGLLSSGVAVPASTAYPSVVFDRVTGAGRVQCTLTDVSSYYGKENRCRN